QQHPYNPSHEAQVIRSRRGSHAADDPHQRAPRPALRDLRRRALPGVERRPRPDGADRRRHGVLPVLHVGQAGARRSRREGRLARGGPGAARHGRAAVRDGRPAEAEGRADGHAGAERVRDRALAEARGRLRDDRPLGAARAEGGRGRPRPRALAHREPRRADHDRRELLRDARRDADPLRPLRRDVGRWRRPARQQRPADLADRDAGLDRRLRPQLHPDQDDLALPRVQRRPRLGAHHRRTRVPDERAAEDLLADDADPEPRPAPGRGDERILHRAGEGQVGGCGALHGSPAAREADRGPRGDRPRDGPPRPLTSAPVGLRDVLFGRKKLPEPKADRLFALTTAAVTLQTELGLTTAGAAAIAFKPQSSGEFRSAFDDVDQLVEAVAQQSGSQVERRSDEYGYDWIVLHDDELEDLVTTAHALASELTAKGFGSQLLAATFRFQGGQNPVYFIYGFKRGAWWPFVPSGDQKRDNATELELKAKLERELPIEADLTRWLALFDAPV